MRRCFSVETQDRICPVLVGANPAAALVELWDPRWRSAAIIGDSNTQRLFGSALEAALEPLVDRLVSLSFPAGEANKTRFTKAVLEDELVAAGIDRDGCVVAVGGGVTLDLAGFVAATYLRGVAHVNVATSLLAQIDAAIGGKTGVNTPAGKNLVGAFHQPRAVLLATDALSSLPEVELRNGLAEAIKHGVVADAEFFAALETWAATGTRTPDDDLIARCAAIKAEIVAGDEREQGRRAVLNFGHTVGHAIEAGTAHTVPHGQAVAVGMLIEGRLANARGGLPAEDCARIKTLLAQVGLPTEPPCPFDVAAPHLMVDKKNREGRVRVALPAALGRMVSEDGRWTTPVEPDELERAWQAG